MDHLDQWASSIAVFPDLQDANPTTPSGNEDNDDDDNSSDMQDDESNDEQQPPPTINTTTADQIGVHVKKALKEKKNILVECPPGLERQMIILQTVLAHYKEEREPNSGKIYFVTNGSKEVNQVLSTIKAKFEWAGDLESIKMAALAPRSCLCIRTSNDGQITSDNECQSLVQNYNNNGNRGNRGASGAICEYYRNSIENFFPDRLFSFTEVSHAVFSGVLIRDMEDFGRHGRENNRCPYFDTRLLHSTADLVVCTNEIILSPVLRREYGIQFRDAIMIFDDGYDLESLSCDAGSIVMSSADLNSWATVFQRLANNIEQLQRERRRLFQNAPETMQLFSALAEPLRALADYVIENGKENNNPPQEDILEHLPTHILNETNCHQLCFALKELPNQPGIEGFNSETFSKMKRFLTIACLALNNLEDYKLTVTEQEGRNKRPEQVLKILCANAAVVFGQAVREAASVIVGGDCLSPLNPMKNYLGIEFQEQYQVAHDNPAAVARNNYFLGYCSTGPNNEKFVLNYNGRQGPNVQREVAEGIVTICQTIPNGVVILFHSRRYFSQIIGYLRGVGLMNQITNIKHVITDYDQGTDDAKMEQYKNQSKLPTEGRNGAVLMCYARGPIYERCRVEQLKDKEVRGIIHVSMPYAAWHYNDYIVSRREYFESHENQHGEPDNGNHDWYEAEAFRISNQAFARCVQNITSDWGIVVVLDSRMHSKRHNFHQLLPAWVTHLNLFRDRNFQNLIDDMTRFINERQGQLEDR